MAFMSNPSSFHPSRCRPSPNETDSGLSQHLQDRQTTYSASAAHIKCERVVDGLFLQSFTSGPISNA
jgi:hypothetical protein